MIHRGPSYVPNWPCVCKSCVCGTSLPHVLPTTRILCLSDHLCYSKAALIINLANALESDRQYNLQFVSFFSIHPSSLLSINGRVFLCTRSIVKCFVGLGNFEQLLSRQCTSLRLGVLCNWNQRRIQTL